MTDRIIDLSEDPARLSVRYSNLVIEREGAEPVTVPLADLAVLVVSHPQVSLTHAVLAGLADSGGAFVACDGRRLPVGMFLPLAGHFTQAERFGHQASASLPTCKRLWQQVVRAKLRAQAHLLSELCGSDHGISVLIPRVRSGDPDNVEGKASRRYWPALFPGGAFYRDRFGPPPNQHLNYGYAVLRAVVARAVCAAGLHPSLGLHHHNRYDAFRLADDLMEPFRPVVDRAVVNLIRRRGTDTPLDRQAKAEILEALSGRLLLNSEWRTLFDVAARTSSSLAAVFAGKRKNLILPEVTRVKPKA
ncbi:MAG: type II CRISPR-associated endonuclease Cas1 [Dehalococcoidia bacterium]